MNYSKMHPSLQLNWERVKQYQAMPYQEYLKTARWEAIRGTALYLARYHCQVCHADAEDGIMLNVHHRCYKHIGMQAEFTDLIVLCEECHRLVHKIDIRN